MISGVILVAVFGAVAIGCLLLVLTLFRVGRRGELWPWTSTTSTRTWSDWRS
jgi:hypothetical protein